MLSVLHTAYDCIKVLTIFRHSEIHFSSQVNYRSSKPTKLFILVQIADFSFLSHECLHVLYFTLVRYNPLSLGLLVATNWNEPNRSLQSSVLFPSLRPLQTSLSCTVFRVTHLTEEEVLLP
jgi:hypothetical protein